MTQDIMLQMLNLAVDGLFRFKVLDLRDNKHVDFEVCQLLGRLLELHSPMTGLLLDKTSVNGKCVAELLKNSESNTNIAHISIKDCRLVDLSNQFTEEYKQIRTSIGKNCSIVKFEMSKDLTIHDSLRERIVDQVEMNREIVDKIFPKVLEQEAEVIKKQIYG
jgi:hypothetical protein